MAEVPDLYSHLSDSLDNKGYETRENISAKTSKSLSIFKKKIQGLLDMEYHDPLNTITIEDLADLHKNDPDVQQYIDYERKKNTLSTQKERDDSAQLSALSRALKALKSENDHIKEIPFEISGGKIQVLNVKPSIKMKGFKIHKIKFDTKTQYNDIGNDSITYNESTNRFEITIDYKGSKKTIEIEYNGGNLVKVFDPFNDNNVKRVKIKAKNITTQEIDRKPNGGIISQTYSTPGEILIKSPRYNIKLNIMFKAD